MAPAEPQTIVTPPTEAAIFLVLPAPTVAAKLSLFAKAGSGGSIGVPGALAGDSGTPAQLARPGSPSGPTRVGGYLGFANSLNTALRGTLGKTLYDQKLYDEALASITDVKQMLDDLKAGKGTAGKLLSDDEIANQIKLISQKVNTTLDKINSGQGTIGQLVVNPQLYDSLNGTMREVNALVKDVHANPKKFLRIKLAIF